MNQSLQGFPSREEGLALHFHLRDQNPAAVADLCRAYLCPLIAWLAARFAGVDPHHRETAVHDALMAYVKKPETYDPRVGIWRPTCGWRRGGTWQTFSSARASATKVAWRGPLSKIGRRSGTYQGRRSLSLELERDEEARQWQAFLDGVAENFTPEERCVLDLMLEGERKTTVYSKALRMEGLSAAEQEREVKKAKDRIKKRLERGVSNHA